MTQEAVVAEEKKRSKTQELRDWLDGEIERCCEGLELIERAFKIVDKIYPQSGIDCDAYKARYGALIPDERDRKVSEDRKKLKELQKRLELLRSARELDVDIDAMESMKSAGLEVEISHSEYEPVQINGRFRHPKVPDHSFEFYFSAGRRRLKFDVMLASHFRFSHEIEDIKTFTIRGYNKHAMVWNHELSWQFFYVPSRMSHSFLADFPKLGQSGDIAMMICPSMGGIG